MLSPRNDKVAVCYRPMKGAGWIDEYTLTPNEPLLPKYWSETLTAGIKDTPDNRDAWACNYYAEVQKRFPVLKDWPYEKADPKLLIHNTINFQELPEQRRGKWAREETQQPNLGLGGRIQMMLAQRQETAMENETELQ